MRIAVGHLNELKQDGLSRLDRIRRVATVAMTSTPTDPPLTYVVIELDNLWAAISRSLYLSSAMGARDVSGSRVSLSRVPTCKTVDEALTHAIRRCKPWRYQPKNQPPRQGPWSWQDEPRWNSTGDLIDSLSEIGASTLSQVRGAVGLSPSLFGDLHAFRNFYAHRGRSTRQELLPIIRRYKLPSTMSATEVLCTHVSSPQGQRPQPLILDWIDDLQDAVAAMA